MERNEREKPEGLVVAETFAEFLEERRGQLKGKSIPEIHAEYLRFMGAPEEVIENHIKIWEKIEKNRAESERREAEARDKLVRQGVIEPGEKLNLPATLILGMVEARKKSTY